MLDVSVKTNFSKQPFDDNGKNLMMETFLEEPQNWERSHICRQCVLSSRLHIKNFLMRRPLFFSGRGLIKNSLLEPSLLYLTGSVTAEN